MASATTGPAAPTPHTHDHAHEEGMACCSHHNVKLEQYMLLYLIGLLFLLEIGRAHV